MDDKVFNLLEKMYSEMQEMKKELKQDITKIQSTMENDIKPKINLCLEELVSVKEKLTEHDTRFDNLGAKIERHDVEISVIKRVK